MCEWMTTEVSELFRLGRGRVISGIEIANNPGNYPVYSSQTKDDGCMGYLSSYDFEGELITWTTDGANAGTVFYRSGKFNCTNVCGTIEAKDKEVTNTKFFSYLLGTLTKRHVSYIGNPKLMNGVMAKVKVHYPDFKHQSAIAKILDTLDTTIRQTEAIIAKLQQIKQGLLYDLLTRGIDANGQLRPPVEQAPHLYKESPLGWIPMEWDSVKIENEADIQHGFAFAGHLFTSESVGPRLLVPGNFHRDGGLYFTKQNTKYFAGKYPKDAVLQNRDVLIVMTDLSPMTLILGRTVVLNESFPVLHNQRIGKFQFKKSDEWDFSFFVEIMNNDRLRMKVIAEATGTTVRHTSPDRIKRGLIPKPSKEEQNEIANRFNALRVRIAVENTELEKFKQQKSALMNDLLTGRVRVTALLSSETPASKELKGKSA